jgi:hypothetical protein
LNERLYAGANAVTAWWLLPWEIYELDAFYARTDRPPGRPIEIVAIYIVASLKWSA